MQFFQTYYAFLKQEIKTTHLTIWFYIFGIGLYSLVFAYITSPPHGMDEGFHFQRALQISQGDLFPKHYENKALGGPLDAKMTYYVANMFANGRKLTFTEKQNYINTLNQLPPNKTTKEIFTPSASYSPVMYIPSATGLFLANVFHGNADTRYFSGRLGNVICYILLLSLIILILPVGRYFTLLFLSMPTNLQMAGSYNADTFTNLLAMLFIACCLRSHETTHHYLHRWKIILSVLAFSLGLLKITYCFLSLFCFLLPHTLFKSKKNYLLFCSVTVLLSIVPALLWNSFYPFDPGIFFHKHDNRLLALHTLIEQPFHILHLIFHTIYINLPTWSLEVYGRLINNNAFFTDLFFIKDLSFCFILIVLITILIEPKKKQLFPTAFLCFSLGLGYAFLVLLAFYISFSPIDSHIIMGLQGRYFIIAVIPIILALLYSLPQKLACKRLLPILLIINFFILSHEVIKAFEIIAN